MIADGADSQRTLTANVKEHGTVVGLTPGGIEEESLVPPTSGGVGRSKVVQHGLCVVVFVGAVDVDGGCSGDGRAVVAVNYVGVGSGAFYVDVLQSNTVALEILYLAGSEWS